MNVNKTARTGLANHIYLQLQPRLRVQGGITLVPNWGEPRADLPQATAWQGA
jgi:hypothetical protein